KTTVSYIMVKDAITVPPTETIGDLCQLFADKNIGGVPVVKDDDVIGIITERDILNAVKRV
ncbi:MAG: CBS domain-containing protein, partial [Methanobrevibacter sp.]|nr:CBS domain-containing protein [Methanobrevibacter sp.]